jgi:hypothetical protein
LTSATKNKERVFRVASDGKSRFLNAAEETRAARASDDEFFERVSIERGLKKKR